MRGLGMSFLVRRARSSWLRLTCVAVTVLLATGLAAVLWTFAGAAVPPAAESALAAPQDRSVALSGVIGDTGQAISDSQIIRGTLRKAWPGTAFQMQSALWSQPLQLSTSTAGTPTVNTGGPSGPAPTQTITQIRPASLEGFSAQTTLTAGTWPGPPARGGGPLPVALPATVASRLHVTIGSLLTGSPQSGGAAVTLRVTGLFRVRNPASPYWALDLVPTSGVGVQKGAFATPSGNAPYVTDSYGPAVVNPAAFDGALNATQGSWLVVPPASPIAHGNIAALAGSTSAAISQLTDILPEGLQVTSRLPQLLDGMATTIVLTRSLFMIAALQLLLVTGAELVLAARLLASLREEESALLRARGATRWQVTAPALAEAMILGAVPALAGVLAGTRLTSAVAGLGGVRLANYSGITPLAWLSALAMLVLCTVVMIWPALRALPPDAARIRRGRQAWLAGIAWAGADLVVVALAAVAVWQLRGYSAVAHQASGSLGIDPVVAVAPALALAGVALIPLRGLPLMARLADKATDYERRLAAAMVSWQIARRPIRQAGPALLVVVATATATLALGGYASWRQSAADQAAFAVGADVRVDSATMLSPSQARAIARAPGVTAATAASVADIGNGSQLIALDPSTAGKTILLRSDLSTLPPNTLWPRITPSSSSGLTLPGEPDRLEVLASLGAAHGSSPAEVRSDLGSVMVTASIQDASGAIYPMSLGILPADGRPHSLVATLSSLRRGSYPLRLAGLSLNYILPPYDAAHPASTLTAAFGIDSLAVASTPSGPFGKPFSGGAALATWRSSETATRVPTGVPNQYGQMPPSNGLVPSSVSWQTSGGTQQLTFATGNQPSGQVMSQVGLSPNTATGQVAITMPTPQAVPVIATAGYLAAHRLSVGSTALVTINGLPATVEIVASVARFPTVFGKNLALIADLADVNATLVGNQASPLPVTRWWLATAGGRVPRLPSGLGLSVTDRASQQAALLHNQLLLAPRQAMLAVGLAAVLLGVLGFSISVAASLRARRTLSAVFAAMGVGRNAQAGQLCLEQFALSLPAAAAGLLAGIGLAELLVPAITLTTSATLPVPSVLTVVPLGPAIALALVTAVVPTAVAALTAARRPDPAARLRAEAA